MPPALTPSRRSELRAQAHKLRPVVFIGDKGLTAEVLAEIDRSLAAHELIKVKAATDEREARAAWMAQICAGLGAHPVQSIGKVLVVYRANPEPAKPAAKAKPAPRPAKPAAPGSPATGSGRPRSRIPSPLPASGPRRRRPRTSR